MTSLLESLNQWLAGAPGLALAGAAGWGVASILLSPCHLASIPLIGGLATFVGIALGGIGVLLVVGGIYLLYQA
mgnify:CR=1 FL=1